MRPSLKGLAAMLLAVLPLSSSFGKAVDETTAKTIGCNYLINKGIQGINSPADLTLSYAKHARIGGKDVVDIYVFNTVDGTGFVMISGDDNVQPVLAWSTEAAFEYEKIAPAASAWIEWYANQIEYVVEKDITANEHIADTWKMLKNGIRPATAAKTTSVSPLLTTTWDQDPYYNALCPGTGSSKAVTGCVATAMAQVMKFWNWPSMGTGFHSYTSPTYGFHSANFGATAYQWSSMPNNLTGGNTATATLMSHCGISVNMNYNTAAAGGSSSVAVSPYSGPINSAEYAFKTYFHYKPTIKSILREGLAAAVPFPSFTTTAWIAALHTELDAGRPILYRGNGSSGGHAWVCDGYTSADDMFHFNWGWGGAGPNGYYLTDDLAPPVLGAGGGGGDFNMSQAAIIQIEPDTYSTFTDNIKMKQPVSYTTSIPVKFGGAVTFKSKIMNSRTTAFTGDISAQVYDASNNMVATIQTYTGQTISAGDSTASMTFSTTGLPRLVSARYSVRLMYKNTGASSWTAVGNNGNIYNYGILDIKNDTDMRLYDTIKVTSGLPVIASSGIAVQARVYNRSDDDFSGSLKAQLVNVNTGTVYPIATNASVVINSYNTATRTFAIASLTAPNGLYALEIQHQYNSSGSYYTTGSKDYPNPILVQVGVWSGVEDLATIKQDVLVYPNPTSDVLNILFNDVRVSEIVMTDITGRVIDRIATDPNASSMQMPVSGHAPGIYVLQLATDRGTIIKKINITE